MMKELENRTCILWDMDGVLLNSEPQHYRAWRRILEENCGIDLNWDWYKGAIGATEAVLDNIMMEHYGLDLNASGVRAKYDAMRAEIEREEGFQATPHILETLETLKGRGYRMAVASSSSPEYIALCIGAIRIDHCFETVLSGTQVLHSKPAPDTFLKAAELLGARPGDCVVVEDSENGTKAARAAGMFCLGYVNPGSGDQDLSAADLLFRDMTELPALLPGPGRSEA